ncbi:hypothetical protein SEA_AMGINE_72 [Mycobacterium phage Amgine]|uniref:Uncharacterized protein n=1 Tax=Mycobacterium phage Amgine TaxID=2015817 RepID=A0A222ZN03_9CAUD|nr:hypothetical protein I5G84_gp72 [Mycobacterium phage Amgine]ASR85672.1 hypothetical protein SEA_AMGINE_72 [Mycobacterium phage Amgine]QTF82072.1 hypothetical protein SEA_FEFFERHEAD_73 [Mycobacterium phage Fefferhead]
MKTETWFSPAGTPVTPHIRNRVDEAKLAELYAAETSTDSAAFNTLYLSVDSATRYAWQYGYRNPRVPGRIEECEALA